MTDCCISPNKLKEKWRPQQLACRVFRIGPISWGFSWLPSALELRSRCIGCHLAFTMSQPRWSAARNPHCKKKRLKPHCNKKRAIHVRKMCKTTNPRAETTKPRAENVQRQQIHVRTSTTSVQASRSTLLCKRADPRYSRAENVQDNKATCGECAETTNPRTNVHNICASEQIHAIVQASRSTLLCKRAAPRYCASEQIHAPACGSQPHLSGVPNCRKNSEDLIAAIPKHEHA